MEKWKQKYHDITEFLLHNQKKQIAHIISTTFSTKNKNYQNLILGVFKSPLIKKTLKKKELAVLAKRVSGRYCQNHGTIFVYQSYDQYTLPMSSFIYYKQTKPKPWINTSWRAISFKMKLSFR